MLTSWTSMHRLIFTRNSALTSFRTGRWRWPWLLLLVVAMPLILVGLVIGLATLSLTGLIPEDNWLDEVSGNTDMLRPGVLSDYLMVSVISGLMAVSALLALRLVKGDSFRLGFTWIGRFHASDLTKAAAAIVLAQSLMHLVIYASDPAAFSVNVSRNDFAVWLALGLAAIFIQSGSEEVVLRGVLFRAFGAVVPVAGLVIPMLIALFVSAHIPNSDMQRDLTLGLIYFSLGELLAYAALLRTKTLAGPIGLHWANNCFLFFGVAMKPGEDTSAAVLIYQDPVYTAGGSYLFDPLTHVVGLSYYAMVALLLFSRWSPLRLPLRQLDSTAELKVSEAGTFTLTGTLSATDDLSRTGGV